MRNYLFYVLAALAVHAHAADMQQVADAAAAKGEAYRDGVDFALGKIGDREEVYCLKNWNINEVFIDTDTGAVIKRAGQMGAARATEEEILVDQLFHFFMPGKGVVPQMEFAELTPELWGTHPLKLQDERQRAVEICDATDTDLIMHIAAQLTPEAQQLWSIYAGEADHPADGYLIPLPWSDPYYAVALREAATYNWEALDGNGEWQPVSFETAYRRAHTHPDEVRSDGDTARLTYALTDGTYQQYRAREAIVWEIKTTAGSWKQLTLHRLHHMLMRHPELLESERVRRAGTDALSHEDYIALSTIAVCDWDYCPRSVWGDNNTTGEFSQLTFVSAKPFIENMELVGELTLEEQDERALLLTERSQLRSIYALLVQLADLHGGNVGFVPTGTGAYDLVLFDTDLAMQESNAFNFYADDDASRISPIRSCLFRTEYADRELSAEVVESLWNTLSDDEQIFEWLWRADSPVYQGMTQKQRGALRSVLNEELRTWVFGNYKFRKEGIPEMRAAFSAHVSSLPDHRLWGLLADKHDVSSQQAREALAQQIFPRATLAQIHAFAERVVNLKCYLNLLKTLDRYTWKQRCLMQPGQLRNLLKWSELPLSSDVRAELIQLTKKDKNAAFRRLREAVKPTYWNMARAIYPTLADIEQSFYLLRSDEELQTGLGIGIGEPKEETYKRIRALVGYPGGDVDVLFQIYARFNGGKLNRPQCEVRRQLEKDLQS